MRARLKARIGRSRSYIYWRKVALQRTRLQPAYTRIGENLLDTTVAVLEYPFEPASRWGWGKPAHTQFSEMFAEREAHYREVAKSMLDGFTTLESVPYADSEDGPCWNNDWWASLDPIRQYCAIVERKPAIYMEVGSGMSTKFAVRAIRDFGLDTRIISIDPAPRYEVDPQCQTIYRQPLEHVDPAVFDQLVAGDILLIDGTHTAFMGADAVVAILEVLPRLNAGVLVGIHDIFLPWDYPPQWSDRWYGEQYVIGAFLLARPADWQIDFPTFYVMKETDILADYAHIWSTVGEPAERWASSLWIERVDST